MNYCNLLLADFLLCAIRPMQQIQNTAPSLVSDLTKLSHCWAHRISNTDVCLQSQKLTNPHLPEGIHQTLLRATSHGLARSDQGFSSPSFYAHVVEWTSSGCLQKNLFMMAYTKTSRSAYNLRSYELLSISFVDEMLLGNRGLFVLSWVSVLFKLSSFTH